MGKWDEQHWNTAITMLLPNDGQFFPGGFLKLRAST
jgi:hypothetical protein